MSVYGGSFEKFTINAVSMVPKGVRWIMCGEQTLLVSASGGNHDCLRNHLSRGDYGLLNEDLLDSLVTES